MICGKLNHFARQCLQSQRSVELDEFDEEPVYNVEAYTVHPAPDRFVTVKLRNSENFMKFQLDTGAECNVIPIHLYKQAMGDIMMVNMKPSDNTIVAFGGITWSLRGQVMLPVSCTEALHGVHCSVT